MTQSQIRQSTSPPADVAVQDAPAAAAPVRKRPRPGERRVQILQTLAGMLEHPRSEKITTAALAARLEVSEAALYRHFASKAQMFEGLIGFIEQTVFGLVTVHDAIENLIPGLARRVWEMGDEVDAREVLRGSVGGAPPRHYAR